MQSSEEDRILVMAATNRPEEIDEAALRYHHVNNNYCCHCSYQYFILRLHSCKEGS